MHHAHPKVREKIHGRFEIRVKSVPMFIHRLNTRKAVFIELSPRSGMLFSFRGGLVAEKTGEMYAMLRDLNQTPHFLQPAGCEG